jgi:hypothetical protein
MPCEWDLWGINDPEYQIICLGNPFFLEAFIMVHHGPCPGPWHLTLTTPDGPTPTATYNPFPYPIPTDFIPTAAGNYSFSLDVKRDNEPESKTIEFIISVFPVFTAGIWDNEDDQNDITGSGLCWGNDATLHIEGVPPGCQVLWTYSIDAGATWNPVPDSETGNTCNTNPFTPEYGWFVNGDYDIQFCGTVNIDSLDLPAEWPLCFTNQVFVSLHIWGTPQAGAITASQVCVDPDVPIQLGISGAVIGESFTWSCTDDLTGQETGTFSYPDTLLNPTLVIHDAGTYHVTLSVENGPCNALVLSQAITIEIPVTATIERTDSPSDLVCYGKCAQLSLVYTGPAAHTVRWEYQINCAGGWIPSGVLSPTTQNTNDLFGHSYNPPVDENNPWAADRICWRAVVQSHTGECPPITTITNTITLYVIQPPGQPTISPGTDIVKCSGEAVTLTAVPPVNGTSADPVSGTGLYTYGWFCDALPVGTGETFEAVLPGNYQVNVYNSLCNFSAESDGVTIRNCTIRVTMKDSCTCPDTGDLMDLSAIPHCILDPTGPAGDCTPPYTFIWGGSYLESLGLDPPVDTTPNNFLPDVPCPDHTLEPGELWLEVTNQHGCTKHVDILIKRCLSKGGKK